MVYAESNEPQQQSIMKTIITTNHTHPNNNNKNNTKTSRTRQLIIQLKAALLPSFSV